MVTDQEISAYKRLQKKFWLKYLLDKILALILLLISMPIFLLLGAMIIIEGWFNPSNKGSIFYLETRISGGKKFQIIKFRTVPENIIQKIKNASGTESITGQRVKTWAGKWILRWYLDELPQLINILKGDMTFVGPRPHILKMHQEDIDAGCTYRNYIRAGLLGIPQACKRDSKYKKLFEKMAEEHKSDLQILNTLDGLYAKKCLEKNIFEIVFFDLAIIFKGLYVVLRGDKNATK